MKFDKLVSIVFEKIPEFSKAYNDELDENYYNSFLGDLGLFTRNAIVDRKPYAIKSLRVICEIYNDFYEDKDFINKMNTNVLEILTDYHITQKTTVDNIDGRCLVAFKELLNSFFFTNFLNDENSNLK